MKRFRVTALMSVMLHTVVEARSAEEALTEAKALAERGALGEDDASGTIDQWEVVEVPPWLR